jgi:hypothetical protein
VSLTQKARQPCLSLILLSDDADETETPADKTMERLELGDATLEELDEYLNAELLFRQNGDSRSARVIKQRRTDDGKTFGQRDKNPMLDSREYEIAFQDGSLETFSANTVVENMYAQIDTEGNRHMIFVGITDHRYYTTVSNAQPTSHKSTNVWDLLDEWDDGTTSWIPLKDIKNSNPN